MNRYICCIVSRWLAERILLYVYIFIHSPVNAVSMFPHCVGYAIEHKTSFVKWTIPVPSLTNKDHFVVFLCSHEHNKCFFSSIAGGFTVH